MVIVVVVGTEVTINFLSAKSVAVKLELVMAPKVLASPNKIMSCGWKLCALPNVIVTIGDPLVVLNALVIAVPDGLVNGWIS